MKQTLLLISTVLVTAHSQLLKDPNASKFLEKIKGKEEAMKGFAKMLKGFKNYAEASAD
jgi:hypothetical protein